MSLFVGRAVCVNCAAKAAGYALSGGMSTYVGWRSTFWAEAALMAPFAILFLFVPPPPKKMSEAPTSALLSATDDDFASFTEAQDSGVPTSFGTNGALRDDEDAPKPLLVALRALLSNPTYVLIVLGYSVFTFVVGCLGLYVPKYTADHLSLSTFTSSVGFGGITAVAGLAGTALGGYIVDRRPHRSENARAVYSLRVAATCVGVGTPIAMAG